MLEREPMNKLVRIEGTPYSNNDDVDNFDFIRIIAITRITMPDTSDRDAYIEQWHGTPLKKNPRYMIVTLASGKTIKSTDLVRNLKDVV